VIERKRFFLDVEADFVVGVAKYKIIIELKIWIVG